MHPYLIELQYWYLNQFPDLKTLSFTENKQLNPIFMVPESESRTYSGKETHYSLNYNHVDICKDISDDDIRMEYMIEFFNQSPNIVTPKIHNILR
mgnify:CR=1 FL=1